MLILLFYGAYSAVCIALYRFIYIRQDTRSAFMRLLMSLLIVPSGLLGAIWLYRVPKDSDNLQVTNDKPVMHMHIRNEDEMRRIPMSEALLLNDHLVCCDLLMDALRDDPKKYLPSIRLALETGDSETSHYAAAAIMDLQGSLVENMRMCRDLYLDNPDDKTRQNNYSSALKACIDSQLMDENTTQQLTTQYCDVLDLQLKDSPSPEVFENRIECALTQNQLDIAISLCELFLSNYPNIDAAYRVYMQCRIKMQDHEGLRIFLLQLSSAPVELNAATLQYVRCLREVLLHAPMDMFTGSRTAAYGSDFLRKY